MQKTYPSLYIFRDSGDDGEELRYSMRSLKNLKDWNGKVYVCGDKCSWFSDKVIHIPFLKGGHYNPYQDSENRVIQAMNSIEEDDFILFNDDFFVTEPAELKDFHSGEIARNQPMTMHKQALGRTREKLIEMGIKKPLNYAIHVPMLMNKQRRLEVSKIVQPTLPNKSILARVVYGNLFAENPELYQDQKTKTHILPKAPFISTQFFTPELHDLFPEKSEFENSGLSLANKPTVHMIWIGSPLNYRHHANISTYERLGYKVKVWTEPPKDFINRDLFDRAKSYALKADYMRLEILYQEGGLYADIDSVMNKPLNITSDLTVMTTPNGYCGNETIYAERHHPALRELIDGAKDHLESLKGKKVNIWDIVGATYITPVLRKYKPQVLTKNEVGTNGSIIRHKYAASWRKDGAGKATKFDLKEWIDE